MCDSGCGYDQTGEKKYGSNNPSSTVSANFPDHDPLFMRVLKALNIPLPREIQDVSASNGL